MSTPLARVPPGVAPGTQEVWLALAADLLGWFRRRGCSTELAEDLRQETFLRVHRGLADLRQSERLSPWVYRIARSVLIDHSRRSRPEDPLPDDALADPTATGGLPGSTGDHRPDRLVASWLPLMIDTLPEATARALRRVELEGWSQAELAEAEGISASGARSRIQRGRRLLRARLDACCEVAWQGEVVDWRPRAPSDCGCGSARA